LILQTFASDGIMVAEVLAAIACWYGLPLGQTSDVSEERQSVDAHASWFAKNNRWGCTAAKLRGPPDMEAGNRLEHSAPSHQYGNALLGARQHEEQYLPGDLMVWPRMKFMLQKTAGLVDSDGWMHDTAFHSDKSLIFRPDSWHMILTTDPPPRAPRDNCDKYSLVCHPSAASLSVASRICDWSWTLG